MFLECKDVWFVPVCHGLLQLRDARIALGRLWRTTPRRNGPSIHRRLPSCQMLFSGVVEARLLCCSWRWNAVDRVPVAARQERWNVFTPNVCSWTTVTCTNQVLRWKIIMKFGVLEVMFLQFGFIFWCGGRSDLEGVSFFLKPLMSS